jgi:predicted RecB family nuclease
MRVRSDRLTSSPTDLANFLACRHKTELDLLAARGRIARPTWEDPLVDVLRERGLEHERAYIDTLRATGLHVVDLSRGDDERLDDAAAAALTLAAMKDGADVIVQAPIVGDGWFGYADVLRRVDGASGLGDWHYEAEDTKLSRETRGGTILQLCVYSHVIGAVQGRMPAQLRVVTPAAVEAYRVDDFAAFYRQLVADYRAFVAGRPAGDATTEYPQPNDHCEVCRWWDVCNKRRRQDDHLSFVAGLGRSHQVEFEGRDLRTLERLASAPPIAFKPRRGSRETCEKLRNQARVQKQQRDEKRPVHELLDAADPDFGLRLLPTPSPGDVFLDFEGDPFAREGGREYLVGVGRVGAGGTFDYQVRWAFTDTEERELFEWLVDELHAAVKADTGAHIYHFAPYEPSAIKRLMTRYASREMEVDDLLRAERFVDLLAVVRRSLRAGVESYSIKKLEPFYGFTRDVDLERAGDQRRVVEVALETGDVAGLSREAREAVEGYNRDDCRSTLDLRNWLEELRAALVATGVDVPRPDRNAEVEEPPVKDRDRQVADLRGRLLERIAGDTPATAEERAAYLMAYLLDWHRREDKVGWWEYFRLCGLTLEELEDEPAAVVKLEFVARIDEKRNKRTGKPTGSVTDRYTYPPQEFEIRRGMTLICQDQTTFGSVVDVDRDHRTIDVEKGKKTADVHPSAAFVHDHVPSEVLADALMRIGESVAAHGVVGSGPFEVGRRLLLGAAPRVGSADLSAARGDDREAQGDLAVRVVSALECSFLPVQGPPGTGKTFTGARMICDLVRRGRKVGVTATGHKVIRNLLEAVAREAAAQKLVVRLGHKVGRDETGGGGDHVTAYGDNDTPRAALSGGDVDVVGGTSWLWARQDFASSVDVLFVDEAGQMSLANVLAVSQAAGSLVLLGDPQQLEQPQKGSHPDGVGVSALEHVLGGHKTMPPERGIFLPVTWRLAPAICGFTSEVFYEGRLEPRAESGVRRLAGTSRFDGAGLRVVEASHDNCRNASDEEVDLVAAIVDELLAPGATWVDRDDDGREVARPLTAKDILVVAPYNAHVARLVERLEPRGVSAGTVDRFQGQEAPVVIYSMATSRPEDAPRGLEFLYNPNRLNVATSRAKGLCILVASPRLFEPECRTPRQMQLANALCRYREVADSQTRRL